MKMYAFFDQKAEAFMTPFFAPTRGHARRSFEDGVADDKSILSRHPEDFFLFELGEFEESSGVFTFEKVSLGNGVEFGKEGA